MCQRNTPECSWRGTAQVRLVHRQAAAAGARGVGGYAPTVGHQKVAFLIKASNHIRNVEHNLSPHVQRVLTTWRAAYGAHQAVIASRTHHLQTASLVGVFASARGLQAPLLKVLGLGAADDHVPNHAWTTTIRHAALVFQ